MAWPEDGGGRGAGGIPPDLEDVIKKAGSFLKDMKNKLPALGRNNCCCYHLACGC